LEAKPPPIPAVLRGRTTSPKGGTTNFTNYSMPLISPNILGNKYIATMIV